MWYFQHVGFFLLLIAANIQVGMQASAFDKEPQDVAAFPGVDVEMQCVIKSEYTSSTYWVDWFINDQETDIGSEANINYVDGNPVTSGNWSVEIVNIGVNQRDGFYHCLYKPFSAPTEKSRIAEVIVVVAPTLSMTFNGDDVTDDEEVTVEADDTEEEFKCEAQGGNPDPVFNWFVDLENITDSAVQDDDSTSILNHAFRSGEDGDNRAILQCRVFVHELLGMQFLNKTLNVQYMIEDFDIKILHDGEETIVIGNKLELECAADGNPEPVYTWSKDTNALQETGRILTRETVKLEDEGLYVCEATNDFGEGSAEQQITVNGPPGFLGEDNCTTEAEVGKNVVLETAVFCSKPQFTSASWTWDDNNITHDSAGEIIHNERIISKLIDAEGGHEAEDCFKAELNILEVNRDDFNDGKITFIVENTVDEIEVSCHIDILGKGNRRSVSCIRVVQVYSIACKLQLM